MYILPKEDDTILGNYDSSLQPRNKITKLDYVSWVENNFDKDEDHNYWTSKEDDGFAPQDKSRWREADLEEEYNKYLIQ